MTRLFLLGPILSFVLHQRSTPNIHASAVAVADQAVGFSGSMEAWKSSIAASFVDVGHPLVTDDILPFEERDGAFWAVPGYSQLKLWPQAAAFFFGETHHLRRLTPGLEKLAVPVGKAWGSFCPDPRPLRAIYLLERGQEEGTENRIEISPVSPREATMELVKNTFNVNVLDNTVLAREFDFYARMALKVPMRRLSFPRRLELLPAVRQAILEDLERLPC